MSEYTKFIDSVVGDIARKIEDEFNESDHPRDDGGKFTSKGNESGSTERKERRGSGKVEQAKALSGRINKAIDKFEAMFKGSNKRQAIEHLYALGVDVDEDSEWDDIEGDVVRAVTKNLSKAEEKARTAKAFGIDSEEDK